MRYATRRAIAVALALCAGLGITAGMVAVEVWRIRQIAYHNVDPARLGTLADVTYYMLYVPNQLITLVGSKPFLDYNSHYIGYGDAYTAMTMIIVSGTLLYGVVVILIGRIVTRALRGSRSPGAAV